MPKSVNKAILVGNVGKDPEVKFLPSGMAVANFTLATSERFKDKSGERQDRTEWHNLVAFQRPAEIVRDYVKKGSSCTSKGNSRRASGTTSGRAEEIQDGNIVNDLVLVVGTRRRRGGGGGARGG